MTPQLGNLADHLTNMSKGSTFASDNFTFPDFEKEKEGDEPWKRKAGSASKPLELEDDE